MLSQNSKKNALINIRVHKSTRDFIDQAAQSIGKDRSDFMLEAAYEKAQDILLDKTLFILNGAQWKQFNQLLDCPPQPNQKLISLLNTSAPWE
ncbi:MAG: DUF1778 domain-containing protein [Enterobacterales bacterium]|nr:DUF1778 domain-containing protein [Enterobacterales bacterium]